MLAGTLYCPTTRRGLACTYSSACLPCICMDQTVNPSSIGTTGQGLPYWMPLQSSGPASKWAFWSTSVAGPAATHNGVLSHARHEEECRQPSPFTLAFSLSSLGLAVSPGVASLDTQSSISELPRLLAIPQASCDHAGSRSHKREWLAPGQSCATPLTGEGSVNACLRG